MSLGRGFLIILIAFLQLLLCSYGSGWKQRIFLGIFSTESRISRRNLLRTSYLQVRPRDHMDVFFILGKPSNETAYQALQKENNTYGDILTLDCPENMNEGKSFDFFRRIYQLHSGSPYTIVFKGDDDAIYHLFNLAARLEPLHQSNLYVGSLTRGFHMPGVSRTRCNFNALGSLYGASWDLVKHLALSNITTLEGPEDIVIADFFARSPLSYLFIDISPDYYHPRSCKPGSVHPTNMIILHPLKEDDLVSTCSRVYFGNGTYPLINATRLKDWQQSSDFFPYVPHHQLKGVDDNSTSFSLVRGCSHKIDYVLHRGVLHAIASDNIYLSPIIEANDASVEALEDEVIQKYPIHEKRLRSPIDLKWLLHKSFRPINESLWTGKLIVINDNNSYVSRQDNVHAADSTHQQTFLSNYSHGIFDHFGNIYLFDVNVSYPSSISSSTSSSSPSLSPPPVDMNAHMIRSPSLENSCIDTFINTGILYWSRQQLYEHRARILDVKVPDICWEGNVITTRSSKRVYLINNRTRSPFQNRNSFLSRGLTFDMVEKIGEWEMNLIPLGPSI